jgi:hypothetical protein
VINWFHFALNHCGLHRLLKTISMHPYHPRLHSIAECITKNCDVPTRNSLVHNMDTCLHEKQLCSCGCGKKLLWISLLHGRLKLEVESYDFYALPCIYPVTNFPDNIYLHDKTASHVGLSQTNLLLMEFMGAPLSNVFYSTLA